MKIVDKNSFSKLIRPNSTLLVGGFGCCGAPDDLLLAIRDKYETEKVPLSLNIISVSGVGNKLGMGLDLLANKNIVNLALSGFWGFTPKLSKLALDGDIKGHNWPLGVVRQWINSIASGNDSYLSNIGMGTFIDPNVDGGRLNAKTDLLISLITDSWGKEKLCYPIFPLDWALMRASSSDLHGNISFENEALLGSSINDAIAVKRFGGKVIVQVEKIVDTIDPHQVKIPGILIDYIVLCKEGKHSPCYGNEKSFKEDSQIQNERKELLAQKVAQTIPNNIRYINFGIGIPALIP